MGKQAEGLIFTGTVGGFTGYFLNGEHVIRKAEIGCKRKERCNNGEFAHVSQAGKAIRKAADMLPNMVYDGTCPSRLVRILNALMLKDTTGRKDERKLTGENLQWLKGFELNSRAPMSETAVLEHKCIYREEAGNAVIDIAFGNCSPINAPHGATHFAVISCVAEVNVEEGGVTRSDGPLTEWMPIGPGKVIETTNTHLLRRKHNGCVFVYIGIAFSRYYLGRHVYMPRESCASIADVMI